MARRSSNQIGDELENDLRSVLGGRRVAQSGGGAFWKGDVGDDDKFLWMAKATDRGGFRITTSLLQEAIRAVRGTLGRGDGWKPGVAVKVEETGEIWCLIRAADLAELMTRPPEDRPKEAGKAAERRARAIRRPLSS